MQYILYMRHTKWENTCITVLVFIMSGVACEPHSAVDVGVESSVGANFCSSSMEMNIV